jgi:hypothetical protein
MLGETNQRFAHIRKKLMYKLFWHQVNKALFNINYNICLEALDDYFEDGMVIPGYKENTRIVYSEIFADVYSGQWFHKDYIHVFRNRLKFIHFATKLNTSDNRKPKMRLNLAVKGYEKGVCFYPTHDYGDTYWTNEDDATLNGRYLKRTRKWIASIASLYTNETTKQRCMLQTNFEVESVIYNHLHIGSNPTIRFLYPNYEPSPYLQGGTLVVPSGITF